MMTITIPSGKAYGCQLLPLIDILIVCKEIRSVNKFFLTKSDSNKKENSRSYSGEERVSPIMSSIGMGSPSVIIIIRS